MPTTDLLNYQKTVQNNLIQLTALERTLNEQILVQGGSSTMGEYLKKTLDQKEALWQSLQIIYQVKKSSTEGSATDYKNVLAAKMAVEKELSNSETLIASYQDKLQGKRRMNQIAEYQYKKYVSYKEILKTVVYFSIAIILLTLLIAQPWFPKLIGKGLIIIFIAYFLYYISGILYWHFRREDKYWDKFRQDAPTEFDGKSGAVSLTKWEHNKKNISKMFGNLGGASGVCQTVTAASADKQDDLLATMMAPGVTSSPANVGDLNEITIYYILYLI